MAVGTKDPIQEQLSQARKAQILDAATKVFAEKGFHRATIRDIAVTAGIADGTIYNYFENKTGVLLGILDRLNETEARAAHYAPAADMDMAEFIRAYLTQRLATLSEASLAVWRVLLPELLVNQDLRERYTRDILAPTMAVGAPYFERWAAAGQLTTADSQLSMRALAAMVVGMLVLRLLGDPYLEEHWAAAPGVLADIVTQGLTSREDGAP